MRMLSTDSRGSSDLFPYLFLKIEMSYLNPQLNFRIATEGELKSRGAGMKIIWGTTSSPFGKVFIAKNPQGISHLSFFDTSEAESLDAVLGDWPLAELERNDNSAQNNGKIIFAAVPETFQPVPIFVKGTSFQIEIWQELMKIQPGQVSSYGRLAERIGRKSSVRAAANAVGRNRISYLIPCHRVIRGNGDLGGYRWGIGRKKAILTSENPNWTATP